MENNEQVLDPKVIEVTIKLAQVGKLTFVLETKKDVSKLVKKAVETGIKYLTKQLEKIENE